DAPRSLASIVSYAPKVAASQPALSTAPRIGNSNRRPGASRPTSARSATEMRRFGRCTIIDAVFDPRGGPERGPERLAVSNQPFEPDPVSTGEGTEPSDSPR